MGTEVVVSFAFSLFTALVAQSWEKISPHLKKLGRSVGSVIPFRTRLQLLKTLISKDEKSTKTKSKPLKEESVNKTEDKGTEDRGPKLSSGPATGDTDSYYQLFFNYLRSQFRKKEPDPEAPGGEGITDRG